jgi:hypothetical protein
MVTHKLNVKSFSAATAMVGSENIAAMSAWERGGGEEG